MSHRPADVERGLAGEIDADGIRGHAHRDLQRREVEVVALGPDLVCPVSNALDGIDAVGTGHALQLAGNDRHSGHPHVAHVRNPATDDRGRLALDDEAPRLGPRVALHVGCRHVHAHVSQVLKRLCGSERHGGARRRAAEREVAGHRRAEDVDGHLHGTAVNAGAVVGNHATDVRIATDAGSTVRRQQIADDRSVPVSGCRRAADVGVDALVGPVVGPDHIVIRDAVGDVGIAEG